MLLKRQLQWLLFLRVVFLSLLLGLSVFLQSRGHGLIIPPLAYVAYFIAGIYLLTIISALLLRHVKRFNRFTYIQLLIDAVLTSCLVVFTGGSQSVFIIIYFFPIITGSFMLFRRGGLFIAAVCTLSYGTILGFEYLGFKPWFLPNLWSMPPDNLMVVMHLFSITGISFFLVAFLSALLSERLRKTEAALSTTALNYDRLSVLYKQIFDDISTGIITVDSAGRITSFNRASERITGYGSDEVLGVLMDRMFPGLRLKGDDDMRPSIELTRKDGRKIPIGYSWARLNLPGDSENCRVYTMQDLSLITKMEEKVRQSEKMAAIGEMAAGIAHEFRNPLAAISGASQVVARDLPVDKANRKLMNIIIRESVRLEKTISAFLRFSKPAAPEKEWFSLSGLLKEVLSILRQSSDWHGGCRLLTDIPEHLDCWADVDQIKQVLLNLINNACIATGGERGEIKIRAREVTETDGREKTVLEISDNGPGISEDVREKIFEPFFTTRENGTGLGLAITRQIIESHNGWIGVRGNGGEGTTFTVSLPLP